jgi:DNA polymerase-3 subunit gamma/tau
MAAIYQEARPFTFEQVVGQEHVKDVLVAALSRGRIGHAYLFSGPRGVGKTTTARLLAMAVNCEDPDISKRPCGICEPCKLIRGGSHPDVIELDAASNNSVDDIRDLREKVRLSSMRGGKRVWVLDEAHAQPRRRQCALEDARGTP